MLRVFIMCLLLLIPGKQGTERGGTEAKVGLPIVMQTLSRAGLSGSLAYWGRCNLGQRLDFPRLESPTEATDDPVKTLRKIFTDDPAMTVSLNDEGTIIRMVERDVPNDLLDIKISHISFDVSSISQGPILNPTDALSTILSASEVSQFMKSHGIVTPFPFQNVNGGRSQSSKSLRLSGSLSNVTLSQALDHILQTFPGLWVYENCPNRNGKRAVDFAIYPNNPGWQVLKHQTKQ